MSEESVMFANDITESHPTYTDCKRDTAESIAVPHIKENGEQFQRNSLEQPPSVTVEIAMMLWTHATFDCIQTSTVSHQSHHIFAFADMGLVRADLRSKNILDTPTGILVPTTHPVHGITNNWLHIKSVLFLHLDLVQGGYDKLCLW